MDNQHSTVEDFVYHIMTSDDFAEELDEVVISGADNSKARYNITTQVRNSLNRISSEKQEWNIHFPHNNNTLTQENGIRGIGVSVEVAFPVKIPGTSAYGFGLDFGLLGDKDGAAPYYTSKVTYEPGMAFGAQLESFLAVKTSSNPKDFITRANLRGSGFETGMGIGPVGGAYGTSNSSSFGEQSSYRVYSGSVGIGIDLGYVNWLTKTYIPDN